MRGKRKGFQANSLAASGARSLLTGRTESDSLLENKCLFNGSVEKEEEDSKMRAGAQPFLRGRRV